jgi:membrane protein
MSFKGVIDFFKKDIWQPHFDPTHRMKSFLIQATRITWQALEGFLGNNGFIRASALSFDFLLSIVPLLAVAFGIAKGFGLQTRLEEALVQQFYDQPGLANQVIQFANSMLSHAQGGIIAGIGVLALLWTALRLIGNIEHALNEIWHVPQDRPLLKQLRDYLVVIFFCPLFFSLSSSLTIFVTSEVNLVAKHNVLFHALSPFVFFLLRLIPYVLSWLLFTFFYLFVPNTRVSLKAGIIAGILAGTAYQIVQHLYISFQIGVSNYGAVYGGFAAIPFFLLWLYISWIIALAGAEIAHQLDLFSWEDSLYDSMGKPKTTISNRTLGLLITKLCVDNFSLGKPPLSSSEISLSLGVVPKHIQNILQKLVSAGVLSDVRKEEKEGYFQPARDLELINIGFVSEALDLSRQDQILASKTLLLDKIVQATHQFDLRAQSIKANLSLKEL